MEEKEVVTCKGVTRKGTRCKKTTGLVNGFCPQHRIAQPEGGAERFKQMVKEVLASAPSDGRTKFAFINGQATEIPIEEEDEETRQAKRVIEKHRPLWEPYVPESGIEDIHHFAHLLTDVEKMTLEELQKELDRLTKEIDERSLKVKNLILETKLKYGEIPQDTSLDIERQNEEIFQLKVKKGLLFGALESASSLVGTETSNEKPFSLLKKGSRFLLALGALLILLLMIFVGEKHFNQFSSEKILPAETIQNRQETIKEPQKEESTVSVDTYIVQEGDTLWDIAEELYGDGSQWTQIWEVNADLLTSDDSRNLDQPGHWIHPGQILHIPTVAFYLFTKSIGRNKR